MKVRVLKNKSVGYTVRVAMLSALAFVLMLLELPLPIFPFWLKLDLADLPALLGSFTLGPVAGCIIELIKNVLHFMLKNDGTGGIGNLANFIVGVSLVLPAGLIYRHNESRRSAIVGAAVGTGVCAVVAAAVNYWVLIPLYAKLFMPMETIIAACSSIIPTVTSVKGYALAFVIPFNLLRCIVTSAVALLIYKPLLRVLKL